MVQIVYLYFNIINMASKNQFQNKSGNNNNNINSNNDNNKNNNF